MKALIHILILALTCIGTPASAQDQCRYLPEFTTLQQQLPGMSTIAAVLALQKHVLEHENPQACELTEVERLLALQEAKLIELTIGAMTLAPQNIFRCNEFNPKSAQCRSPMEDGTAHPMLANLKFKPYPQPVLPGALQSALPNAKLIGLYQTTLAAALDGKSARKLAKGKPIRLKPEADGTVLIAIYQTSGPWAYRKAVWYFK